MTEQANASATVTVAASKVAKASAPKASKPAMGHNLPSMPETKAVEAALAFVTALGNAAKAEHVGMAAIIAAGAAHKPLTDKDVSAYRPAVRKELDKAFDEGTAKVYTAHVMTVMQAASCGCDFAGRVGRNAVYQAATAFMHKVRDGSKRPAGFKADDWKPRTVKGGKAAENAKDAPKGGDKSGAAHALAKGDAALAVMLETVAGDEAFKALFVKWYGNTAKFLANMG
jgi:hypothetical protein